MTLFPLVFVAGALATPGFDATTPQAVFDGATCATQDGQIRLWSRVERLADPDRVLFRAEAFNGGTAWPASSAFAPWIADMFGTATPHASTFLLHAGANLPSTSGTPILLVPGAGDNASRGFVTMAARLDLRGRPVYAMTFAHPHGDVFAHAEAIANAIARVRADTGAAYVDVVAHSKGGVELAVYLSHATGADWGATPTANAYEAVGTPYRGDVRNAVFVASPLGGIDTAFRWTNGNVFSLDADTAIAPTSWRAYRAYGNPLLRTDLAAQDFLPEDGDLFPGQRQLLARQAPPLPGATPALGAYAVQTDWYTTYEGGVGFLSESDGIDAAVAAGGDLIATLASRGVDPAVRIHLLAGSNPLMPNGAAEYAAAIFGEGIAELGADLRTAYATLVADAVGDGLIEHGVAEEEVEGLVSGALVLGEISGPSDGLVFVDSATRADALTARGARVVGAAVRNLSHIDLLYASPVTGQLLVDASDDALGNAWMAAVGRRYTSEDSLGWIETALADTGESGVADGAADTGEPGAGAGPADPGGVWGGCTGCAGVPGAPPSLVAVLAVGWFTRRRR